jgi:hypothetical protein
MEWYLGLGGDFRLEGGKNIASGILHQKTVLHLLVINKIRTSEMGGFVCRMCPASRVVPLRPWKAIFISLFLGP